MTAPPPIRLAVVDDSAFVRKALCRLFENDEHVVVVGTASCGEDLLEHLDEWNPTVVTLDLSMPGIGGLATLDELLRRRRIPVIVLSAHSSEEAPITIEALNRGAVDFIDKQQFSLVDFDALRSVLTEKLLHILPSSSSPPLRRAPEPLRGRAPSPVAVPGEYDVLLIGASTGGPPAIETLLQLVGDVQIPIAIVQHMPVGFTAAFADRLDAHLPIRVVEARHGAPFVPGVAHIARAGMHLKLHRDGDRVVTKLSRHPDQASHSPSVDVLFDSALPFAKRTIAVLLTGMGDDGAQGLSRLAAAGAMTLVQDEDTCIVYGMPRAAVALNAAREQLPLRSIGRRIAELLAPRA